MAFSARDLKKRLSDQLSPSSGSGFASAKVVIGGKAHCYNSRVRISASDVYDEMSKQNMAAVTSVRVIPCVIAAAWTAVLFSVASVEAAYGANPTTPSAKSRPAADSQTSDVMAPFQTDPDLLRKITVDEVDRPLSDVLSGLSLKMKTELLASSDVADQRVTLHAVDQPVLVLMTRLTQILSHSVTRTTGYYWGRMDRLKGTRPGILLWRDLRSRTEEQDARDTPRRKMAVLLRDMRDLSRMTPEQRDQYKGELHKGYMQGEFFQPFHDAMALMSDADLDALMAGQHIPLDPSRFTARIDRFRQSEQARIANDRAEALAAGRPAPNDDPALTPPALYVKVDDDDGWRPDQAGLFGIFIDGMDTRPYGENIPLGAVAHLSLDPLQPNFLLPPEPLGIPEGGPVYDLTPILNNKAVTDRQRQDLGFNLQALARVAHLTLYQEAFLTPSDRERTFTGVNAEQPVTKGTLAQLLGAMRKTWDCRIKKAGNDILVWNRAWVQCRANDVPQRLIEDWHREMHGQPVTTALRSKIAATLTWPQVRLTLDPALPESGPWDMGPDMYRGLRLLGNLSSQEHDTASSPSGLALADMLPWQQQSFTQDIAEELTKVPSDQIAQSVLTVAEVPGTPNDDGTRWDRTTINLLSGDQTLWSIVVISPLPPFATAALKK